MKRILLPLMLTGMIMASGAINAQALRHVIRKTVIEPTIMVNDIVQDKAEEEAEKQITKAIMEGFGVSEDVRLDKEYKFDSWFQMQITDYRKNGKVDEQLVYDNYFCKSKLDYGMEVREDETLSTILYDADSSAMIILTDEDGEKTGFATRFDPETFDETVDEDELENSKLNPYKTGKTKKILGYSCDEYLIEEDNSEVHMWISEKLGKEVRKEILRNPNAFGTTFHYSLAVNGMTLQYEIINTTSGEKTEMLVTDLDLNHKHSIHTSGYTVITMNLQE